MRQFPHSAGRQIRSSSKDDQTLTVIDDDDGDTMDATIVGASPHAIRGFFIAGPVGSRYREDFTWTLAADGSAFTQTTKCVYQEGPSQGQGGICVGRARRV